LPPCASWGLDWALGGLDGVDRARVSVFDHNACDLWHYCLVRLCQIVASNTPGAALMAAHGSKRQHLSRRIFCIGTRCSTIFTHTTHPHASSSMKTPTASIYKHEDQTHTPCRLSKSLLISRRVDVALKVLLPPRHGHRCSHLVSLLVGHEGHGFNGRG